ncbi:LIM/homeobox protein Awh-like [Actinia tenebrosa]|uniref:LIM/homeobox protein Awh-like n=1 Tax=Actinia tenebrosa TaxID=6105 RepID=A0A6P8IRN1_ACTTE|nr:LIM/homeobox protein Awh-like [Actinia tenebrosa]
MLMTTPHEDKALSSPSLNSVDHVSTQGERCVGCEARILDRYLVKVSGRAWHTKCLRCCVCGEELGREATCYTKDNKIYCKGDYARQFGTKCARCGRSIHANDWVRRAKNCVYHLACFACDNCKRQLSTGEEFALKDDNVLCKLHYLESLDASPTERDYQEVFSPDMDSQDSPGSTGRSSRHKAKRVRTTFTEEQLQILQANFNIDSNPDGQDLERIAQLTGLSKRVTQVWFQNSRARQKKYGTPLYSPSQRASATASY